jgi:hypothetical protein
MTHERAQSLRNGSSDRSDRLPARAGDGAVAFVAALRYGKERAKGKSPTSLRRSRRQTNEQQSPIAQPAQIGGIARTSARKASNSGGRAV